MHSYPKISIIISSLHNGNKLIKTLKNIEKQQYTNLEIFIVQKKYILKNKDFLEKYQHFNINFSELKVKNVAEAFNTTFEKISGEITHFVEAGYEYEKHALFKVATAFKNQHTNIVYGKNILIDTDKQSRVIVNRLYHESIAKTIAWTRQTEPQYFYRTKSIENFRFQTGLKYWHHVDMLYKYLLEFGVNGILKINDTLLHFYQKAHNPNPVNKQIEQNTYFYSLAKEQGFELMINFFEKNLVIRNTMPLNLHLQYREMGRQIMNSFILLKASQLYMQRDKKKTEVFLNQIDKDKLSKGDIKLWESINFRNKYIPTPILNLFRKN